MIYDLKQPRGAIVTVMDVLPDRVRRIARETYMLELPETMTMARQLNEAVAGKTISAVMPPTKAHKFCWYLGDPASYAQALLDAAVINAAAFGIFCELAFDNGKRLCFNDGVNVRLLRAADAPKDYQLLLLFCDGDALVFTVAMYGGIIVHDGAYDNEYYLSSKRAVTPFSPDFVACYWSQLAKSKETLSAKAFLATEQRFPGIGNGTAQDILFAAGLHPKRKIGTWSDADRERLLHAIISVLGEMTAQGGRDTEKDLYGKAGGYRTRMSKNALISACPVCGGAITKEAYLGGSVYYCPKCQTLP